MNQPILPPEIDRLRELVRKLAPFAIRTVNDEVELTAYKICLVCDGKSLKSFPIPDNHQVRHETECELRPYVDTCSDND